ncbi:1800_t:CDS:2, partial [Rhizophagus irregularis]
MKKIKPVQEVNTMNASFNSRLQKPVKAEVNQKDSKKRVNRKSKSSTQDDINNYSTNPNSNDINFINDQSSLEHAEIIQNSKTNINSGNSFTIKSGCDELKDSSQNRTVSIRDDIDITVQIGDDNSQQLVHLNLKDKLSSIRGKLEHHSMIKMDDALLFAKSNNQNYALIAREEEDKIILAEIMDTENKILYLRKNSVRSDITVKIVSLPNLNDYSSSN